MPEGIFFPDVSEISGFEKKEKLRDIEKVAKIKASTVEEALLLVGELRERQEKEALENKEANHQVERHNWINNAVSGALSQIRENKEPYITVSNRTGPESQKEGVPVDGLISSLLEGVDLDGTTEFQAKDLQSGRLRDEVLRDVLHPFSRLYNEKIDNIDSKEEEITSHIDWILEKIGNDINPDDRRRLELARDLISSSERYFDLNRDSSMVSPETNRRDANHWRTQQEAYYVSQEGDFRHHESEDGDYIRVAMEYLNRRREVFIDLEDISTDSESTYTKGRKDLREPGLVINTKELKPGPDSTAIKPFDKIEPYKGDEGMVRVDPVEGPIVSVPEKKGPILPYGSDETHPPLYRADGSPATPGYEPLPHERGKEKIILVDASEIAKAMAWRIAENRLNEIIKYDSGPDPRSILGRLWKRVKLPFTRTRQFFASEFAKLGEQGYLNKFYREALIEIENNQDLLTDIKGRLLGRSETTTRSRAGKDEHYRMLDAVVKEVREEVIEEAEKGVDVIGGGAIFAELINRHLSGEFKDRNAFEEAARQVIQQALDDGRLKREQFSTEGREADADGVLFATNLYEVAERYSKSAMAEVGRATDAEITPEKEEKLKGIMAGIGNLDLKLATKFQDLNESRARRPDGRGGNLSFWEKAASWATTRPILGLVCNPTTAGLLSGLATRGALRNTALFGATAGLATIGGAAALGAVGTLALPLVVGAAVAAPLAYIRRRRNLSFDRGMEQRREVLGLRGEGTRAKIIRDLGFEGISKKADALLPGVEGGDEGALLEASALFEAERQLRDMGRPVDLIWSGEEEGRENRSNIVSKVDLKVAVKKATERIRDPKWKDRVNNKVADIIQSVKQQDAKFEKYRVSEGLKAGGFAAVTAGVLGAAAEQFGDVIQDHFNPEEAVNRVTLLEYIAGERPEVEYLEVGGEIFTADQIQSAPDGSRFVDVPLEEPIGSTEPCSLRYIINPDGSTTLDYENSQLPSGYSFGENGEINHIVSEAIEGGPLNEESWNQLREYATSQHPETFDQTHANWVKFYENNTPPVGNSYEQGYIANSEGTELQMDFNHGSEGYSVDLSRMDGHIAFGSGGEFQIDQDTPMLITIGLRERALSHEVLIMEISPGKPAVFPDDIGEQIFEMVDDRVALKPGFMITANGIQGIANGVGEGDATNLCHTAADYTTGEGRVIPQEAVIETIPLPHASYNPPGILGGPIPIPLYYRAPIGNPGDKEVDKKATGEDTPKGQNPNDYTPESDSAPPAPPAYTKREVDRPITSGPAVLPLAPSYSGDTPRGPDTSGDYFGREEDDPTGIPDRRDVIKLRSMAAAADRFYGISNMSTFKERKAALIAGKQKMIDEGVIGPNDAFLLIDGRKVSYEELEEKDDAKIKMELKKMANELKRPLADRSNRDARKRNAQRRAA